LLIPGLLLLASVALPVAPIVAAPAAESDGLFSFAGVLAFLLAVLISAPLFLIGFVWLLAALARRRPARRDPVGWLICVPLGLLSGAMTLLGGLSLGIDLSSGGPSGFVWLEVAVSLAGLLGLFVVVMSLVGHQTRVGAHTRAA
jgi:hypothetical protein